MKIRHYGLLDYETTVQAMQTFTAERNPDSEDELWLCQHPPVYTLGQAALPEHILNPADIPIVRTNRGGQVTYHGPGQLMAYPLIDLKRAGIYVREYVFRLEESVLRTLAAYGVTGHRVRGAPGIYVRPADPYSHAMLAAAQDADAPPVFDGLAKIAALGIKVTHNCTYHGLALNVAMDLHPYAGINPCGYESLATTDMHTIGVHADMTGVEHVLAGELAQRLGS